MPTTHKRPTIIDAYNHAADMTDLNSRAEWQGGMGRSESSAIHTLAISRAASAKSTQAPEVLKSMIASIEGDVANVSKVNEQISNLAERMDQSNKAMKTVTKIYHAMCLQGERAAQSSPQHR
jgi:hypothetical protein